MQALVPKPTAPGAPAQAQPQQQQAPTAVAGPGEVTIAEQMPIRTGGFKTPLDPQKVDPRMLRYFGMDPNDFDFRAARLALGDTSVLTGAGVGKQAAALKSALRARADQYWMDRGLGPQQANAAVQEFAAQKAGARSLAQQEAKITGALKTAMQTAPRVLETSNNVDRTRFPDLNKIILAGKEKTGDPNVVQFGIAIETFINNYARAMNGGNNVLTDSARDQARSILAKYWSQGQINAAIDQSLVEMDAELQGIHGSMGGYLGTEPGVRYHRGDAFKGLPGQPQAQPGTTGGGARAPVRVGSPEEARKLPPGTPIILPDGRTGTVPGP